MLGSFSNGERLLVNPFRWIEILVKQLLYVENIQGLWHGVMRVMAAFFPEGHLVPSGLLGLVERLVGPV